MTSARVRDRILIAGTSVLTAAIITAMAADFGTNSELEVEAIEQSVATSADGRWSLQFLGDTMLSDGAQPLLDATGYDTPFSAIQPLLDGDYIIANLESPISEQILPLNPGKAYSYNSDPLAAPALRRAGVDALGLGNNHSMDMARAGLLDTMRFAAGNGMATFGAGEDLTQAERPLLIHSELGTVGVVGIGEYFGKSSKASIDTAGTVVFAPDTIQRGIDLAHAAGADWVVAYVHWGDNYSNTNAEQRYWAQLLVDAGYDLIVGSGPHVAGPIQFIGSTPVVYSIGNFVFGSPGRFSGFGHEGIGLAVSIEMSPHSSAQIAVRCMLTDNDEVDFVPKPCSEEKTRSVMPTISPQLVIQGNVARMPCNCMGPTLSDG